MSDRVPDPPLTDKGAEQAERVAAHLSGGGHLLEAERGTSGDKGRPFLGRAPLQSHDTRPRDRSAHRRSHATAGARVGRHPRGGRAVSRHGDFIRGLLKALVNHLPSRGLWYDHYNTAVTRLNLSGSGRLVVNYMNRTDHLTDGLLS